MTASSIDAPHSGDCLCTHQDNRGQRLLRKNARVQEARKWVWRRSLGAKPKDAGMRLPAIPARLLLRAFRHNRSAYRHPAPSTAPWPSRSFRAEDLSRHCFPGAPGRPCSHWSSRRTMAHVGNELTTSARSTNARPVSFATVQLHRVGSARLPPPPRQPAVTLRCRAPSTAQADSPGTVCPHSEMVGNSGSRSSNRIRQD